MLITQLSDRIRASALFKMYYPFYEKHEIFNQ